MVSATLADLVPGAVFEIERTVRGRRLYGGHVAEARRVVLRAVVARLHPVGDAGDRVKVFYDLPVGGGILIERCDTPVLVERVT